MTASEEPHRFIGVWQQESGKGPQIANGAAYCVPDLQLADLTPHALPPRRALLGRLDPLGSRLLQTRPRENQVWTWRGVHQTAEPS